VPLAQRRRHPLTSRAAVLALVVCALALALAYPLREYLSQRGEIAALERKTVEQERAVADLMLQRERWRDPAYVAAQARERLHFVRPGETAYVLLDPGETPARLAPKSAVAPERPWFSDLWASIDAADRPQP
jgi:cell division protein FtsB